MSNRRSAVFATLCIVIAALTMAAGGCQRRSDQLPPGVFEAAGDSNCLPDATLIDQHGNTVNFGALKAKWLLVDFIYTRCPGPCEMMTSKLARAANHLGAALGGNIEIVSVTLDPEHDHAEQLLNWAGAQGAERKGWLFLGGSLPEIEKVMAAFKVKRTVEANGMIDHVTEIFLIDPNGRQRRLYSPNEATPEAIANDVMALTSQN
ncbi:MAG: SCO family protein [Candidatus Binataceae bacterium]